ncbi:flagellar export protein FliJ [Acetatifactor muris]|uniref:Flagellar FliJ protein n=1 Tax=Acetatifactor muris TaxID=879566 RepID=A0A2K4ZII3_9FIRM|nr:flagellar export protein FliJ [Acetatifactor muris]MCR2048651.1 flagellar export protein FliJ [Acetatifactor muris]SOY30289.1 flagellar biosynthesis chaperone [Acetatifactor muris]
MARFRYSMQSILNIKLKLETQARQEFSAARAALDEEEDRLQALFDRKSGYESRRTTLLSGRLNLREIEENKTAILCMEDYIERQQMNVDTAERKLEEARERLTEVRMERKTHETLRDKAFQEFLMEEKKQESKEIDQLTSYTYGQRRAQASV